MEWGPVLFFEELNHANRDVVTHRGVTCRSINCSSCVCIEIVYFVLGNSSSFLVGPDLLSPR